MDNELLKYFYLAEAEGLLPSRRGKLNMVINLIVEDPLDTSTYEEKFKKAGLDIDTVTNKELKYVINEVNKRLR